jgi:HEAT repeat protein
MSFWKKLFGRKKKVEAFTVEPNVEELKVKKDVEGLIMALGYRKESVKMDDVLVRGYAAMTLGKIRNERAVEPLIQALQDKKWDISYLAIEALGNIADPRDIKLIKKSAIETDIGRLRAGIVLDEIFNLSKVELREVFLKSKASMEAKKELM